MDEIADAKGGGCVDGANFPAKCAENGRSLAFGPHIVFSPECERRELEGEKLWPALNMS